MHICTHMHTRRNMHCHTFALKETRSVHARESDEPVFSFPHTTRVWNINTAINERRSSSAPHRIGARAHTGNALARLRARACVSLRVCGCACAGAGAVMGAGSASVDRLTPHPPTLTGMYVPPCNSPTPPPPLFFHFSFFIYFYFSFYFKWHTSSPPLQPATRSSDLGTSCPSPGHARPPPNHGSLAGVCV
jgi:hypothetical protein